MATRSKLAVIVHADVVGSTALVRKDEHLAHDRIQGAFQKFSHTLQRYGGVVHEIRGDALVAEFSRASDAVLGALAAQQRNAEFNIEIADEIVPQIRVGIALGEVVIADDTLTGAGVVLAQRLEQLAEPGGICISAAVREAVPDRLAVGYSDLGAQEAKGFDERVVAYSVSLEPGEALPEPSPPIVEYQVERPKRQRFAAVIVALVLIGGGLITWLQPWKSEVKRADPAKMAYALPDKPSVAVLPFENVSHAKEEEYFSDGITEDIITDLSKVSGIFVVAQTSTLKYKAESADIRKVAEELGVRYVLEGSLRRAGEKLRITAKLFDAIKGNQLWAERYDREVKDVFAVQSDVTQRVVAAMAVTLKANEVERLYRKHTTNLEAYESFLRGRKTVLTPSRNNVDFAEQLFMRAIELDPKFAGGYAGLSLNHSMKARFRYGSSPEADRKRSLELAKKAIEVDKEFAWSYIALGGAYLAHRDPDSAVDAVRQALVIQPNGYEENLWMGFYAHFTGQSELAVEHLEKADRLSPTDTVRKLSFLAMAYFMNGNYEKSEEKWRVRLQKYPVGNPIPHTFLSAALDLLGKTAEAAAVAAEYRERNPEFRLAKWRYIDLYKSEENRKRLYDAAKRAGIRE